MSLSVIDCPAPITTRTNENTIAANTNGKTESFCHHLKSNANTSEMTLRKNTARKGMIRGRFLRTAASSMTDILHPCRPHQAFFLGASGLYSASLHFVSGKSTSNQTFKSLSMLAGTSRLQRATLYCEGNSEVIGDRPRFLH